MGSEYVYIEPQVEIFEYGHGEDKSILLGADSVHRVSHPKEIQTRYALNEASKVIILLLDGTRTIDEIKKHLLDNYDRETEESIEIIWDAFCSILEEFEEFKLGFSDYPIKRSVTYSVFESHYPSVVSLELTNQCNMRCRHCYGDFGHKINRFELPRESLGPLFKSLSEIGVTTVELTGGDPSVYPHIVEAIEQVFSNGISNVTYLSNGLVLSNSVLNILSKYKDSVLAQIDLHSFDDDYFEWFTGVSHGVEKVKKNILKLINSGVNVFVAMIVTPTNLDEVMEIASWAFSVGAVQFSASPVVELGRAYGCEEELVIRQENDVRKLNAVLMEMDDAFPGFLKKPKHPSKVGRINCGAIVPHATVDSRGNIKICPMDSFSEIGNTIGNVMEKDIKEIFNEKKEFIKDFGTLEPPYMFDESCSHCENAVFCHTCIVRGLIASKFRAKSCGWVKTVPDSIKQVLGLEGSA